MKLVASILGPFLKPTDYPNPITPTHRGYSLGLASGDDTFLLLRQSSSARS